VPVLVQEAGHSGLRWADAGNLRTAGLFGTSLLRGFVSTALLFNAQLLWLLARQLGKACCQVCERKFLILAP